MCNIRSEFYYQMRHITPTNVHGKEYRELPFQRLSWLEVYQFNVYTFDITTTAVCKAI